MSSSMSSSLVSSSLSSSSFSAGIAAPSFPASSKSCSTSSSFISAFVPAAPSLPVPSFNILLLPPFFNHLGVKGLFFLASLSARTFFCTHSLCSGDGSPTTQCADTEKCGATKRRKSSLRFSAMRLAWFSATRKCRFASFTRVARNVRTDLLSMLGIPNEKVGRSRVLMRPGCLLHLGFRSFCESPLFKHQSKIFLSLSSTNSGWSSRKWST
mmetsp:Transcript_124716/g.347313  ORF Transcript_124716/g.347313 Transcript_124716/m.347313 type:complete len:212 (-) Transcript_124716:99-734(-)